MFVCTRAMTLIQPTTCTMVAFTTTNGIIRAHMILPHPNMQSRYNIQLVLMPYPLHPFGMDELLDVISYRTQVNNVTCCRYYILCHQS